MIELRSADKAYWTLHGVVTALTDIDIAAPGGRVLAVTGGAGSGKSTLLRLLALQEAPDAGEVRLFGRPLDVAHAAGLEAIRAQHRITPVENAHATIRLALTDALTKLPRLLLWDDADRDLDGDLPGPALGRIARLAHERGIAVVIAGRDASVLARYADDIAVLDDGQLVEFGPADVVPTVLPAGHGTRRGRRPLPPQPAARRTGSRLSLFEPALAL